MSDENWTLLLPILIHRLDRLGVTEQDIPKPIVEQMARNGGQHIREALAHIREFFMPARVENHKRRASTINRRDR